MEERVYFDEPALIIDPVAVGNRIKELRIKRGFKVYQISAFMGFRNDQAIYKWERGESVPTTDHLIPLARLFKTTVDYILTGEDYLLAGADA